MPAGSRLHAYSPKTHHCEPSWAAEIPLNDACAMGVRYRQDAIFYILGDTLSVTHCDGDSELVPMGGFRERLGVEE